MDSETTLKQEIAWATHLSLQVRLEMIALHCLCYFKQMLSIYENSFLF